MKGFVKKNYIFFLDCIVEYVCNSHNRKRDLQKITNESDRGKNNV